MRTKDYEANDVRRILIGMATNQVVAARISSKWTQDGLFESRWANLIGGWCVDHQQKFGKPAGSKLTARFERWAEHTAPDEATTSAVEQFLRALSDQHEHDAVDDPQYLVDLAARHFNQVRVKQAYKEAQQSIENGRYEEARQRMNGVREIEFASRALLEPAENFEAWEDALQEERRRPLVTYPGEAGKFISDAFVRGEFYTFEAPDKTGKSTLLVDFTYRGCRAKNRVAFFDTGDGSEAEFLVRLGCRTTNTADHAKLTEMPTGFDDKGDLVTVERRVERVNAVDAYRAFRKLCRGPDALRVECHPNSTLSVSDIDGILQEWSLDGWRPDIVVVDYADILAPPDGMQDTNQQIDQTWKQLRRLSQARNCLVVTATQTKASAYSNDKKLLGRQHFSGRKTKNAEVNGMIGVNVSEEERKKHMARWNWIVRRKDRRVGAITVAGNFDIGNPVICSRW